MNTLKTNFLISISTEEKYQDIKIGLYADRPTEMKQENTFTSSATDFIISV